MDDISALDFGPKFDQMTSARNEAVELLAWLNRLSIDQDQSHSTTSIHEALTKPRSIGRYRLRSLVGMGSYGVVFRAEDPHTDRLVALKVAWPFIMGDPEASERFIQESQVVGRLQHDQVVQVFDAGTSDLVHYIAFEFIDGPDLGAWIRSQNQIPVRQAADIVRQVADAVECAHDEGIVHRDLKPSNILMRPTGNPGVPDPVVTDFGLARRALLQDRSQFTATRAVIGTDRYMSPEQAAGSSSGVTPASDVFSLGVILYELLSGVRPFDGESSEQIRERIQVVEPLSVRALRRDCSAELEAVVNKSMEKRSDKRYRNAGELADELQRFLAGKPVQARLPGPFHRIWKFARRHPVGVLGVAAALMVAMIATGIAGAIVAERKAAAQRITLAQASAAEAKGMERQHQYATEIRYAARSIAQGNQAVTLAHLDDAKKLAVAPVSKGIEWDILSAMANDVDRVIPANVFGVRIVRFSPTEDLMITGGSDKRLIFWNTNTWKSSRIALAASVQSPKAAEFSPDGSLIAVVGENGRVVVHRLADQSIVFDRKVIEGNLFAVTWYEGSRRLAVGGAGATVVAIDLDTGTVRSSPPIEPSERSRAIDPNHPNEVSDIYYLPSRKLFGVIKSPAELVLIEPSELREVERWGGDHCVYGSGVVCQNEISRGIIAVAGANYLRLCDTRDGKTIASLELSGLIEKICFSSTTGLIAGCFRDGSIETWNAEDLLKGRNLRQQKWTGHNGRAHSVDISRDGRWMASGGRDGKIRVWANPGQGQASETRLSNEPVFLKFSPCKRWLLLGESMLNGIVRVSLFSATSGQRQWSVDQKQISDAIAQDLGMIGMIFPVAFHPSGDELAMLSDDRLIIARSSVTGDVLRTIVEGRVRSNRFFYAANGKQFVAYGMANKEMSNRLLVEGLKKDVQLIGSFMTPQGELWVEADGPRRCILRRRLDGPHLKYLAPTEERFNVVDLSRDSKLLAGAGLSPVVYLWDISSDAAPSRLIAHEGPIVNLQFSHDGLTLFSLDGKGILKCWHVPTRSELLTIGSANEKIICMSLHPSDGLLVLGVKRHDSFFLRVYRLGPDSKNLPTTFEVVDANP